jgi:hypothetical protein
MTQAPKPRLSLERARALLREYPDADLSAFVVEREDGTLADRWDYVDPDSPVARAERARLDAIAARGASK